MSRKVRSSTAKLLRIKLGDDTDRHANIFIEPRVGYRMEEEMHEREDGSSEGR